MQGPLKKKKKNNNKKSQWELVPRKVIRTVVGLNDQSDQRGEQLHNGD